MPHLNFILSNLEAAKICAGAGACDTNPKIATENSVRVNGFCQYLMLPLK